MEIHSKTLKIVVSREGLTKVQEVSHSRRACSSKRQSHSVVQLGFDALN